MHPKLFQKSKKLTMRQIETFLYSNPKNNQLKISSTEITRQLLDRIVLGLYGSLRVFIKNLEPSFFKGKIPRFLGKLS